jgi:hypothetical protein
VTRDPRLAELRAEFKLRTCLDERERIKPCWFAAVDPLQHPCEGVIQACHFIKQQRIRKELKSRLLRPWPGGQSYIPYDEYEVEAPIWDQRLAVPGCVAHHDRFDAHREPPLRLTWDQIPDEVMEWAEEFGFVWALKREHEGGIRGEAA